MQEYFVTKLKSKGRARTQIAKQRKLRATKITRMAQQRHLDMQEYFRGVVDKPNSFFAPFSTTSELFLAGTCFFSGHLQVEML
jgi:hypothetical protein